MTESTSLKLPVSLHCGGITLESGSGTECPRVENSGGFPCLLQREKKRNSEPLFCNALILGYPTFSPIFGASSNKLYCAPSRHKVRLTSHIYPLLYGIAPICGPLPYNQTKVVTIKDEDAVNSPPPPP
jgi:hypothetical protein